MAKNISLLGADYPGVPAVQLPQTGGGTATFYDVQVMSQKVTVTTTGGGGVRITNFTDYNEQTDTPLFAVSPEANANRYCVFTGTDDGKPAWIQVREGNSVLASTQINIRLYWLRIG